ncbi:actin-related protein 5-like isoform X2 [Oncorhynchus tshawytscha]|uniref:actin-related protein 5-like isoform X2 n=1 Tax=Oncorhynchus tshawytscha TaxID=74940 RepID=UPI000D0A757F|nr:actin-related protein 5-like isoform X2 [Oncorhynchus tshawytscha]
MQRGLTTVGAPRLLFKSLAARNRGTARSESQIRNDISNLEPLRWLIKSWFDRNVVVNFEIQELMFFSHLGDGADGSEEHPIVLTEAPCNPLHSRQMMLDACERGQEPGGVLLPASAPAEVHWSPGGRHPLPHRELLHKHSYTANNYHQELDPSLPRFWAAW